MGFQVWMALAYLGIYGVYVAFVFKGPKAGGKLSSASVASSQEGLEVAGLGDYGSDSSVDCVPDENVIDARWM